jgi:alcohol dehydrogenase (cytochrome c)
VLAGTNPTMATGGFTGRRGGRAGAPAGAAPPGGGGFGGAPGGRGRGGNRGASGPASVTLADGRVLTGTLMAQSEFDATLLADGKFYLLARDGDVYREKPIEPKSDWLTYGGSPGAGRYRALDQINLGNVHRLGVAWILPMPNSPRLEVTPVVADGVMYVTGWNEIVAVDSTTGRQLWSYSQPRTEGLLSEAGTGANRGAAISGDRVFMVTDHAHVLAFNRFTGQKLWDTEMASHTDGYSATVAPLIAGDLVIQGVSGGEEGVRGFLDAYHVATGERAWRFYTIPKRGEKGSETWIGQAIDHGCGATWQTGSYDAALGLIYWGVGNPCPDYTGDERLGDNLYTASVVALSVKTGELKWHYQFTPHDTHDWDSAQPMVLADEVWRGQPRKLLMTGNRNGMFYVLDRTNGEVLLVDNLSTKVTWHKGFTKDGKPIVDPGSIATREGVAVCPGGSGGANMPDVSYNPMTKLFYVRVSDSCGVYASADDPLSGNRWFGRGTPGEKARADLQKLLEGYRVSYFVRAMDPFTGKKVWDYAVPFGHEGLMSTGGGLVFSGSTAGGLMAFDARTGKPVWHINLAQVTSQATPMTYMVGGKQYIALAGMGVIVAYALPGR